MPYIEDENLLFIHIPKNAGKSIDVALGLVSPDDLGKIGQRSVMNRAITLAQRLCANKFSRKKLYGTHDYTLCTQHLTLQEIQLLNLIPTERWPSIKSFAVFREPLARTVSTFMHFIGNGSATSKEFERFCFSWYSEHSNDHNIIVHRRRQIDFILDCRGRVGVDRVLLFDNLSAEFSNLCVDWGLHSARLPHIGRQADKALADRLYTDSAKSVIHKLFFEDFEFYESMASKR